MEAVKQEEISLLQSWNFVNSCCINIVMDKEIIVPVSSNKLHVMPVIGNLSF